MTKNSLLVLKLVEVECGPIDETHFLGLLKPIVPRLSAGLLRICFTPRDPFLLITLRTSETNFVDEMERTHVSPKALDFFN